MFPPRVGEAGDQSVRHGITSERHDDGDRLGRLLGSGDRWHSPRNDDVHLEPDQLGREGREPLVLSLCKSVLDRHVLALHVSDLS